ncbi:MAG: type III-A CRISPR-associated RAMP protein Csm3 [Sutterella sp.]|nr:type III-A CRISPR-associated RAMP protein Csm3 [Sutterella sp.]
MKLTKILTIKAQLVCVSGLHIGAGDTEMHIGGIDNTVIRNPLTNVPYIPGSSLKGKIRSLLEWRSGAVREKPLSWKDYENGERKDVLAILQLFGAGAGDQLTSEEAYVLGPSRLSFWDCELNEAWRKGIDDANRLTTEAKSENSINRISGKAENPRYTERVIAGARFDFRLSMKVLEGEEDGLLRMLLSGLRLLEADSLGGSGSRGYGKVKFENLTIDGEDKQAAFEAIDPFAV